MRESANLQRPQTWNRFSYAFNNPVTLVDPDGRAGLKCIIKGIAGGYRQATRAQAVRKASKEAHAVNVVGKRKSGKSRKAKRVAHEANQGKRVIRHDAHREDELPHWQPSNGRKGHVHYKKLATLAAIGAAVGDKALAATGSEIADDITAFVVDFVNPAGDIKEASDFAEEVFTDILEFVCDVELDEQEIFEEEPDAE